MLTGFFHTNITTLLVVIFSKLLSRRANAPQNNPCVFGEDMKTGAKLTAAVLTCV